MTDFYMTYMAQPPLSQESGKSLSTIGFMDNGPQLVDTERII